MIIIFKNNKPKALLSDLITSEEFAADRWHVYTYISCSWMKIQRISTLGDGTSCVFISMVGLFKNHLCVISSIFAYFHLVFTVRDLAWIFVIGNVTCIKCHTLHFPVRSCRVDALLKKKTKSIQYMVMVTSWYIPCRGLGSLETDDGGCHFIRAPSK